jgi:hypothetical protein
MKLSFIAAAVAIATTSFGASATTFTETERHNANVVKYTLGSLSSSVKAVEYIGTLDSGSSFAAFCIELATPYASPLTGTLGGFSETQAENLSKLFSGAGWSSNGWETDAIGNGDAAKITALQVGVWEIVYDTDFNLGSGTFAVDAAAQSAYGSMITGWMNAGNTLMANNIFGLRDGLRGNGNQQDLVIAVPEPSTYALMLAGLGAIGFVARRRARRG